MVHASACVIVECYEARGEFGENERETRIARRSTESNSSLYSPNFQDLRSHWRRCRRYLNSRELNPRSYTSFFITDISNNPKRHQSSTSSPGRFSLALEVEAPWGRGWTVFSVVVFFQDNIGVDEKLRHFRSFARTSFFFHKVFDCKLFNFYGGFLSGVYQIQLPTTLWNYLTLYAQARFQSQTNDYAN